ncbi:TPA: DNA cytosine methyltransferase, partial [Neisseria meningitidis]
KWRRSLDKQKPTVGSLFAGIGGFDLGFEQAGFDTAWQVEINPVPRAVLTDRFPHAKQFEDVRTVSSELWPVDVIIGGFPCQDVSIAGKRKGLAGERTGLFYDAMRIVDQLKPRWIVLENVTGLLNSNNGEDFQTVIKSLAECGYVGYWRVLNAAYFGVPTARRRVFLVAGLGEYPPMSLWLTPAQLESYLARLTRAGCKSRMVLCLEGFPMEPLTAQAQIFSLRPTDGVRWLSGKERLTMMGFSSEWMRPTLRRLKLRETPSVRRSHAGLPKN